jgi:hypothetical protein
MTPAFCLNTIGWPRHPARDGGSEIQFKGQRVIGDLGPAYYRL